MVFKSLQYCMLPRIWQALFLLFPILVLNQTHGALKPKDNYTCGRPQECCKCFHAKFCGSLSATKWVNYNTHILCTSFLYWSECRALMSLFQFSLECGIFYDLESTYLYLNLHLKMLEKDAEFLYYENLFWHALPLKYSN